MEGGDDEAARAPSGELTAEDALLRAFLLAGWGGEARGQARTLSALVQPHPGRSCLEGGAPIQFTVDSPGPPGVRVGLQLGDRFDPDRVGDVMEEAERSALASLLDRMPSPAHRSVGTWLFWTRARRSLFVDLRDPDPDDALERLESVLDADARARLAGWRTRLPEARPWTLRLEADASGTPVRMHVHWLVDRHRAPAEVAERLVPGAWRDAVRVWSHLLRLPGQSGRFTLATPLDARSTPALRIGNSGWAMVPEDPAKHRAVRILAEALDGPADHAQALFDLLRSGAAGGARIGRACEVRVTPEGVRARLFMVPDLQAGATAVISSSERVDSSTDPTSAEPSSR